MAPRTHAHPVDSSADVLKGSDLFELDRARIIQDPESLRASSIREGTAWQAWAQLRDVTLLQMNSSDHNPAIRLGAVPTDSWELSTPQLAQYHGQHGFVLSSANWDPHPMVNEIESFTIALANMDIAVAQRIIRFTNPFLLLPNILMTRPESPAAFI
jgi:histidine ammonia-lyase